jgi:hypothetical protein
MPKNVLVVGVPRSGTSMTSYVFASQGYFAATDPESELRGGDENNPTGYWEAAGLIEANVDVFKAVGYPNHNTWLFDAITADQAERIAAVTPIDNHKDLVERYNANSPWIWKDPRLCYTLAYWWPLLNHKTTAVLLLTRNAEHVFKSFLRMGWRKSATDHDEVVARLAAHISAAEHAIRELHIPHIEVAYEDFESKPEETARKISDFFGLTLASQDLKFNGLLNHSSRKGGMVARMERLAAALPASWRSFMKKLTPGSLMNKFFPGRRK